MYADIVEQPRRIPVLQKGIKQFDGESERIGDQKSALSEHDWLHVCVNTLREPIAEVQEKRGISRHQRFTFVDLVSALFNNSYNSCMCIITMIIGLLPLLEGLLNLVRFILDKILEIYECECMSKKIMKAGIFLGQLFIIFIIVSLIYTIILMPVTHLIEYTFCKIWRLVN